MASPPNSPSPCTTLPTACAASPATCSTVSTTAEAAPPTAPATSPATSLTSSTTELTASPTSSQKLIVLLLGYVTSPRVTAPLSQIAATRSVRDVTQGCRWPN